MSYKTLPEKILQPTVAAYIAGLVDGEGTIGLWQVHGRRSSQGFRPVIQICNTHLGMLEWVKDQVGFGWLKCTNPGAAERYNHKPLYRLLFRGSEQRWLLPQIRPYLIIKAEQADLLAQYFAEVQDTQPENRVKLFALASGMKELNRRGVANISGSS